ncbi:MAG: hypothetical protein AAFY17_06165, partial [Cyanobacteria bacterium J06642_11]
MSQDSPEVNKNPDAEKYIYTATFDETLWQLPRTDDIEAIARNFGQEVIDSQPDTLYGLLVATTETGESILLKGVSGLSDGQPGWVPSVSNRVRILLLEGSVLATLNRLKANLIELQQSPVRTAHHQLMQTYQTRLEQMKSSHRERKATRDLNRRHCRHTLQGHALTEALNTLNRASQQDKLQLRHLKQERDQDLAPLLKEITQANQQIQVLK